MKDIQSYLAAKRAEEAEKNLPDWDVLDFIEAGATGEEYLDYVFERAFRKAAKDY